MKLSIGILAHNEADSIAVLLQSLSQQSVLTSKNNKYTIEIIVVSNGCTDSTALIARNTLENIAKLVVKNKQALCNWQVREIAEAGKSNAWNRFIHEFAAADSEFFCLMDADIKLHDHHAIAKMLKVLVNNPQYWIALDQPIKDVELKEDKNWLERLSVAVSKSSNAGQLYICGQLYCGRANPLRDIWMPPGLPVEDGFLTQMIIHENFTLKNPTFSKRIVRVAEASHIFEAYTNPLELLNHEVRVVVGIVVNIFLIYYLQEKCSPELTAGMLIKKLNQENHFWLNDFVRNFLVREKYWLIPISLVFRRYRSLKNHSSWKAWLRVPVATLAFIVDISIFIRANSTLRRKVISNYW